MTRFGEAATPFADAIGVLQAARARGMRLGLITNGGSEMQRSKIAALGVEPLLDVIVVSSEVGLQKPDAAIFQLALSKLGCEAGQAWFVGDHPELDVNGAVSAGLRAFWVKTGAIRIAETAGVHLSCLAELIAHLDAP